MFKCLKFIGIYQWFSAKLQYLYCISNGDTTVLHQTIDMISIKSLVQNLETMESQFCLQNKSFERVAEIVFGCDSFDIKTISHHMCNISRW